MNQEEEVSRKDEYCNDNTVTHTCCSFVDLSEKYVCCMSVFMNACAMSVWIYCVRQLTKVRMFDVSYTDD